MSIDRLTPSRVAQGQPGGSRLSSVATRLRTVERAARAIRHSRRLARLDSVWNRLRPAYERFLRVAGRGSVVRVVNGDTPINLLLEHREIPDQWEPAVWHHLMARIRPGDVFVDVGAHIGLYSVAVAKRVGPSGQVHAFEPDPNTFRSLQAHVRMNRVAGVVRVHPAAVGDANGTVDFNAAGNAESSVATSVHTERVTVLATTLDEALRDVAVSILKIDVEGYEGHVLRGCRALLGDPRRAPRWIYVEMHPFAWPLHGTTFDDIRDLLESNGYLLLHLDGSPVTAVVEWSEIIAERARR